MRFPEKEKEIINGPNCLIVKSDITDPLSVQSAVEEGIKKFGTIDAVLNNAGYGAVGILKMPNQVR
jgi:NAD(P)-dependent dehydrogenase (short-subunit alcohol dehydrogenase family)